MNSDEKRFFKLYVQKYAKQDGNIYQTLFDAINSELQKRGEVNEERLKKQVKGLSLSSYFSSAKNKLKEMIGYALFEMQSRQSEQFALYRQAAVANILHDKGFVEEADKQLKKMMSAAAGKDYHTLWLDGALHRYNHSGARPSVQVKDLFIWQEEVQEQQRRLQDLMEKVLLNRLAFMNYLALPGTLDNKAKKMLREEVLQQQLANAQTDYTKYLSLNALVFHYDKQRNQDKLMVHTRLQKEVLEHSLTKTHRYKGEFFVAYQNYLGSLNPVKQQKEIVAGTQAYENAAQQYLDATEHEAFCNALVSASMLRLNTFIENSHLQGLAQELALSIQRFRKLQEHLPPAKKVVFQMMIKDGLFVMQRYPECLRWIKLVKNSIPAGTLHNRRVCNLFTEFIIFIETKASIKALKNSEESLRYAIAGLQAAEDLSTSLHVVIKGLRTYASARNREERQEALRELRKLAVAYRTLPNRQLANIISESGLVQWLRAKGEDL